MHLLLVEPNPARRRQLSLLLTTTGGFSVSAINSLNPATRNQQQRADIIMISQRLYQQALVSIPCIIFDANQHTVMSPPIIGCIHQHTADIAIAEHVRQLWEAHSRL
ncbi:hypothetical protein [Neptunicella sp.]|uniref:hypothetical protein n=1 Tax=Neptunicella sp. TaxID=2125986 RepID=UPI003F68EA28